MANTIKLADYLLRRLRELGVESVFGVPGDYNLRLLDFVEPAGVKWIGTCNELNAGYAADAYSRVKGISALLTTFGVGELSAINAIAGAYAELAPVVHIVGSPIRTSQKSRALIHHTLKDGEFTRFAQMHALVTVSQAIISDTRTAPAQIDAVLEQCLVHHRPVYIQVPDDMVHLQVDATRLDTPISIPAPVDEDAIERAVEAILKKLKESRKPMILVDGEIRAHGTVAEINDFIAATKWPTFVTSFAKGLVEEAPENVYGVYHGLVKPDQKAYVDSRDLIIIFGPHFSTTNSSGGTAVPDPSISIVIDANEVRLPGTTVAIADIPAKEVVTQLVRAVQTVTLPAGEPFTPTESQPSILLADLPREAQIKQDNLAPIFSSFLRTNDTILAETGTAGYIARDLVLPPQTGYLAHTTWLSIGYMLPASLGIATARREVMRGSGADPDSARTILVIGDGSLQMTVQEISTILRTHLNVIIFVVNNRGYLIERCIHGWKAAYNDLQDWRYLEAGSFFGAREGESATWRCRTYGELEEAFMDPILIDGRGLRMVELVLERDDAPEGLWRMLEGLRGKSRKEVMNGL